MAIGGLVFPKTPQITLNTFKIDIIKQMQIGFDTSPLQTGHKVRGIGTYTHNLLEHLKKHKQVELTEFSTPQEAPEADIVHYPYFDLFFHTLPIKKQTKRVVTVHDVIPLVFPAYFPIGTKGSINFFLQKMALKKTDLIVCDSKTSKKDIIDKLNFPREKIKVVYLAQGDNFRKILDKSRLEKFRRNLNLPQKFALYVGDVNWNKNLPGLISAVEKTEVPLVLVGLSITDETLEPTQKINHLIKELNLEGKVIKTGFLSEEELINVYNLASVTVVPSFYEGFGLSVLESMACGTPVVCSQNSSLEEIAPANLAFYCDPSDPDNIASKITKALSLSQSQKNNLSQKLIAHAKTFSWEKVAKQTLGAYEEILKQK